MHRPGLMFLRKHYQAGHVARLQLVQHMRQFGPLRRIDIPSRNHHPVRLIQNIFSRYRRIQIDALYFEFFSAQRPFQRSRQRSFLCYDHYVG